MQPSHPYQAKLHVESSFPQPRIQRCKRKTPHVPLSDGHKGKDTTPNLTTCLESPNICQDQGQCTAFMTMNLHSFTKQGYQRLIITLFFVDHASHELLMNDAASIRGSHGEYCNTKAQLFEGQHVIRNIRQCVRVSPLEGALPSGCLTPS